MKKKLLFFAAAWLIGTAAMAQPMAVRQPGSRAALPELHLTKTTNPSRVTLHTIREDVTREGWSETSRNTLNTSRNTLHSLRAIADADAALFEVFPNRPNISSIHQRHF